jgi:hypothetical protein
MFQKSHENIIKINGMEEEQEFKGGSGIGSGTFLKSS